MIFQKNPQYYSYLLLYACRFLSLYQTQYYQDLYLGAPYLDIPRSVTFFWSSEDSPSSLFYFLGYTYTYEWDTLNYFP